MGYISIMYLPQIRPSSGVVAGGQEGPLNFGLPENCRKILLLSENFRSKMQHVEPKTPVIGKFGGKIEILSTHNLICRKIAAFCPA